MLSKRKSFGDYTIGKTIGQGAFSKVKIAYNKVTKEEVAIKIINKKQLEVKNKKTQENKELYKKRREHEEYKRKKAIENAVHQHSAPKINVDNPGLIDFNKKNNIEEKYTKIPSYRDNNQENEKTDNLEKTTNDTKANTNSDVKDDKELMNDNTLSKDKIQSIVNEDKNTSNALKSDLDTLSTTNSKESSIIETHDIRKIPHEPSIIPEELETNEGEEEKKTVKNENENDENPKKTSENSEINEEGDKLTNIPESINLPTGKSESCSNSYTSKRISCASTRSYREPVNNYPSRKFSVDSSIKSIPNPPTRSRKFSLDSNSQSHVVNDTNDVCTPLKEIEDVIDDKSIFLTDHSIIPLPSYYERLQNEVQLMMRLDHPNIIKIYQVIESEDETLIVMEYAPGGELIDYILTKKHLNESEARRFFRQIISAIDHCHMANVVHRDLKLENLLLSKDKNILITDFGLGRTFDGSTKDYMTTFCGTPNYAAVELISGIPYIGVKSDVWALGVILYVMMTGKPPFDGKSINALYRRIKRIDYKVPSYFSKDLSNLLAKIFVKDPEKRAGINDLRDDPWVNYEEIEKPIRIFPINAQDMEQIVSGITNGNGYISYIFREQSTSPKKKESSMNLSMALSQNNINDCHLISNERRKSVVYDDIRRRLNSCSSCKSPAAAASPECARSPYRNKTSCEIPNMDIWGGVLVDSSFSQRLRNKTASIIDTSSNGIGGGGAINNNNNSSGLKRNSEYYSTSDITRSSSSSAANRHYLRLNTNINNTPNLINSAAVDDRNPVNPRYYSIVNISSIDSNSNSSTNDDENNSESSKNDGIQPLKSYSKSVNQINDESLYTKQNGKIELGKNKADNKSNNNGITNLFGKKRNKVDNANNINSKYECAPMSPLNPNYPTPLNKKASSAFSIPMTLNSQPNQPSNLNCINEDNTPEPLNHDSRLMSKSMASPFNEKGLGSPEIFEDEFGSANNDLNSPTDDGLPNFEEIEQWHLIHKPSKTVRSTRLNFNKSTATSKPPYTLFQNLCWALYEMKNVYPNRFYFIRNPDYYLFECHLLSDDLNTVCLKFEVEVCKVWLLRLYALRIKRITGNSFQYEELYNELISLLKTDEEVMSKDSSTFEEISTEVPVQ